MGDVKPGNKFKWKKTRRIENVLHVDTTILSPLSSQENRNKEIEIGSL
jgi:hypothetical protein